MAIIDIVPSWNHILTNIQCLLGVDAVIAGGALRDTYLNKPISDVDIFVWDEPNGDKQNNGLSVHNLSSWEIALDVCNGENIVFEYNDGSIKKDAKKQPTQQPITPASRQLSTIFTPIPSNPFANIIQSTPVKKTKIGYCGISNSYRDTNIKAVFSVLKTDGTLYQIILLKIPPKEYIEQYFDIGLCKIYYDGKRTVLTPDFTSDVTNNTLTLCGQFNQLTLYRTVHYHIPKLLKKYPNRQVIFNPKVFS